MDERADGAAAGPERAAMARVRHDLLTPLNGVIGYAGILREDAADLGLHDMLPALDAILRDARETVAILSRVVRADGGTDADAVVAEVRDRCRVPALRIRDGARALLEAPRPGGAETMESDLRRVRDSADDLLRLIDGMRDAYDRQAGAAPHLPDPT